MGECLANPDGTCVPSLIQSSRAGDKMNVSRFKPRWHRVCLNTIVRKEKKLDSERLRILPMGSKVYVVEQVERRVKIEEPIKGWCSLKSSNGDTILTPLDEAGSEEEDEEMKDYEKDLKQEEEK